MTLQAIESAVAIAVLAVLFAASGYAQDRTAPQSAASPATRAEEIEKARETKAAGLTPEEVTKTERFLRDLREKNRTPDADGSVSRLLCS